MKKLLPIVLICLLPFVGNAQSDTLFLDVPDFTETVVLSPNLYTECTCNGFKKEEWPQIGEMDSCEIRLYELAEQLNQATGLYEMTIINEYQISKMYRAGMDRWERWDYDLKGNETDRYHLNKTGRVVKHHSTIQNPTTKKSLPVVETRFQFVIEPLFLDE